MQLTVEFKKKLERDVGNVKGTEMEKEEKWNGEKGCLTTEKENGVNKQIK